MSSQHEKSKTGYVTLEEPERARLGKYIADEGDGPAARHFGISKFTLARAAIGCAVQVGSALVIRTGLAAL
jgi:hypothetical protein